VPKKRQILVNPVINEFVFDCLMTSTVESRKNLTDRYLRAARHSKTATAFANSSTFEEKVILLSKLGINFAWVFNVDEKKVREMMKDNRYEQQNVINHMIENKAIVVSDKQFMQYLGLLSSNVHSETWVMNREFLKVGLRMKQWKKEYYNTTHNETRTGRYASMDISKLLFYSSAVSDNMEGIVGITATAMQVLLYMYSKQKEFISLSEVKAVLTGIQRNFKISRSITQLKNAKYIEKSYLSDEPEYKVTALGADAVLRLQKRIFNAENF